jgi:hypothetical protein
MAPFAFSFGAIVVFAVSTIQFRYTAFEILDRPTINDDWEIMCTEDLEFCETHLRTYTLIWTTMGYFSVIFLYPVGLYILLFDAMSHDDEEMAQATATDDISSFAQQQRMRDLQYTASQAGNDDRPNPPFLSWSPNDDQIPAGYASHNDRPHLNGISRSWSATQRVSRIAVASANFFTRSAQRQRMRDHLNQKGAALEMVTMEIPGQTECSICLEDLEANKALDIVTTEVPVSQVELQGTNQVRQPAQAAWEDQSSRSVCFPDLGWSCYHLGSPPKTLPSPITWLHLVFVLFCSGATNANRAGVSTLPCGHSFHASCILAWLEEHNRCPLCREGEKTLRF